MSRKSDKRGRSKSTLGSFVGIERYLLNSKAWLDLKPLPRAAYVEIAAGYDGRNNGRIAFASRQLGNRLGVSKATASRAIAELERHGFVVTTRRSSFNHKQKMAAEYRLTAFRCDVSGQPPSKDFISWKGKIQNTVAAMKPDGFIHDTVDEKRRRKRTEQLHPCNREGQASGAHGFTHEPHLYSSHTVEASLSAPQGAAIHGASAPASVNKPTDPPDAWTDVYGAALKSLAELRDSLAPDNQSWAPQDFAPSQHCETRHKSLDSLRRC